MPVGIQEQRIQPAVEIVVMRDVAARALAQVELLQAFAEETQDAVRHCPARRAAGLLAERDLEEIGDRSAVDDERAVHVRLAKPKLGVEHGRPLRFVSGETDGNRLAGAVTDLEDAAARCSDLHIAALEH